MASWLLRFAAITVMACWSASALAQAPRPRIGNQCDVTFNPVVLSQAYDPMSPDDYIVSFTATARRSEEDIRAEYSAVLLRHHNYRLPTEMYVLADDGGGGGTDVIYERPGPSLQEGLDDAGEIDLIFDSGSFAVTRNFDLQLRIPAGTEIDQGTQEAVFDVKYLCNYQDGRPDRGHSNRAFTIEFTVTNSVQVSLVGTEPDFGEIGTLSNIDVAGAPPSTTERIHYLRVASSGPYEVDVVSQNGWRMTATGGPTGDDAERIAYRYELLGQRLSSSRPNFDPVQCEAAGVSGENIELTATLTEGGQGKVPSANYRDIITITVTPLAVAGRRTQRCD